MVSGHIKNSLKCVRMPVTHFYQSWGNWTWSLMSGASAEISEISVLLVPAVRRGGSVVLPYLTARTIPDRQAWRLRNKNPPFCLAALIMLDMALQRIQSDKIELIFSSHTIRISWKINKITFVFFWIVSSKSVYCLLSVLCFNCFSWHHHRTVVWDWDFEIFFWLLFIYSVPELSYNDEQIHKFEK